jgi:hypothetical protein
LNEQWLLLTLSRIQIQIHVHGYGEQLIEWNFKDLPLTSSWSSTTAARLGVSFTFFDAGYYGL